MMDNWFGLSQVTGYITANRHVDHDLLIYYYSVKKTDPVAYPTRDRLRQTSTRPTSTYGERNAVQDGFPSRKLNRSLVNHAQ